MSGPDALPANLPPNVDKTLLPVVVTAVFGSISTLVVLFRLIARWKGNGFKLDDYCMIAALVCRLVCTSPFMPLIFERFAI